MEKSMTNLGLKRKIWIAVALISLFPLIVLIYYFYGYHISLWAAIIMLFVIGLGWFIVFDVFTSIIKIYARSKNTLKRIGGEAPVVSDEVQSLEVVIGLLSEKVKGSFEQLKDFTRMTGELNREVSKKVLILSTILQANDLFSKETPAEEVIKFLISHLSQLLGVKMCFCSLRDSALAEFKTVAYVGVELSQIKTFTEKRKNEVLRLRKTAVIDKDNKPRSYMSWAQDLKMRNMVVVPIISKGQNIGIIGAGNTEDDFSFFEDDLDVLSLVSQNITLIWEHERLSSKIDELEIRDYLTGLYNEKMMTKRLNEEVKRANTYQRPCGFIRVEIVNYKEYQEKFGLIEAEKVLKKTAQAFKEILRPIDIGGRIGPSALGAILIESNKRKSREVAGKLEENLTRVCSSEVKLVFSVAESPIDGGTAEELMQFARKHSK